MQNTNSEYGSPYLFVCHVTILFLDSLKINICDDNRIKELVTILRKKKEIYLKSKPNVSPLLKLVGGSIDKSDL